MKKSKAEHVFDKIESLFTLLTNGNWNSQ